MIYFNMDGALGAPKAIMADGNVVAITTDIALAVAQIYHNFTNPVTQLLFKKGIEFFLGKKRSHNVLFRFNLFYRNVNNVILFRAKGRKAVVVGTRLLTHTH